MAPSHRPGGFRTPGRALDARSTWATVPSWVPCGDASARTVLGTVAHQTVEPTCTARVIGFLLPVYRFGTSRRRTSDTQEHVESNGRPYVTYRDLVDLRSPPEGLLRDLDEASSDIQELLLSLLARARLSCLTLFQEPDGPSGQGRRWQTEGHRSRRRLL